MPASRVRDAPALVAFVGLGLIWGSNFIFMKWATEWLTAGQVTVARVVFGLVPIAVVAVVRRDLSWQHLRYWRHFLVMSVLATSVYYWAFIAATDRLPSGIAGALSGAIPLFSFLAAAVFLRSEPLTRRSALGVLIGFAGVLLIARPWQADEGVDPVGVALMLLGSASVGVSFVYARRFVTPLRLPGTALTTYQMSLALLTLLLVTDLSGITEISVDRRATLGLVVGLGLLGTGIAYLLYYFVIDRLGAVRASGATYIPPVVALLIGWALVHEPITVSDGAAVALILTGVFLLQTRRPQPT